MRVRDIRPEAMQRLARVGMTLFLACLVAATTVILPRRGSTSDDPAAARMDQSAWDQILKQYVDDAGLVAYRRIASEAQPELDDYLARLAATDPVTMRPQDQLAFWINAYNAGVVVAVIRDYSPESALSRVKLFRWYTFPVAGKDRSLDEIEHQILRKQFHDPRIHFAVVCGATSCPKLRREAYRGDRLDEQLDDQAGRFINDPARNRIDVARRTVELSSIFEWFASDFAAADGSVAAFVARYVQTPAQADIVRQHTDQLTFLEYDWTLNAQKEGTGSATNAPNDRTEGLCPVSRDALARLGGASSDLGDCARGADG